MAAGALAPASAHAARLACVGSGRSARLNPCIHRPTLRSAASWTMLLLISIFGIATGLRASGPLGSMRAPRMRPQRCASFHRHQSPPPTPPPVTATARPRARRHASPCALVVSIGSTEEFNQALETAGESLVVIDYSTSWCGPCKIIAPKFEEMSEKYTKVAFLKVMGDASPEADKLMRSQGVRALPSFHFWKNKKQIDSISGAKTQALIDAIETHQ